MKKDRNNSFHTAKLPSKISDNINNNGKGLTSQLLTATTLEIAEIDKLESNFASRNNSNSSFNFENIARFKSLKNSNTILSNNDSNKIIFNHNKKLTKSLKKKKLNIYKIYKTYRYRNYRLHCVRLRRLETKEKLKRRRLSYQNKFLHSNIQKSSKFFFNISKLKNLEETAIFINDNNNKSLKNIDIESKKRKHITSDISEKESDVISINSIIDRSTTNSSRDDSSNIFSSSSGDETSSLVDCLHMASLNSEPENKKINKTIIKQNLIGVKSNQVSRNQFNEKKKKRSIRENF